MTQVWTETFPDYVSFYRATYGSAIVGVHETAIPGVSFVEARQGAGDWSDAPVPELIIAKLDRGSGMSTIDLGAGRFREDIPAAHCLRPGNGILVSPETATSIYMEAPHKLRVVGIPYGFLLDLTSDLDLPSDGDFGVAHSMPFANSFVYAVFDELWAESQTGNPRGRLFAEAGLLAITATLCHLAQAPVKVAAGGLAAWQLRRTTAHLHDRVGETMTLKELAAIARLSVFHFCRAFKTSTGLTPHRYQTRLRVERAQALLADTSISVTDIAPLVGYETPQAFARMFRQAVGTSPTAYRRSL